MEAVIEKSFEIEEPINKVWANLSNPMEAVSYTHLTLPTILLV